MNEQNSGLSRTIPWLLFLIVILIPFLFWANRLDWQIAEASKYLVFPLLGIIAWGLMWTHYAYGALRLVWPNTFQKNRLYSKVTGVLVLFLIFLHPALLALEQKSNTGELPPQSFYDYVASNDKIFILFGSISLMIFLSFEVFNRLKDKPLIKRNWRWISLSQILAMTLIFVHGLALGNIIGSTSLELYWVILGALLIPCFGLVGKEDWSNKPTD